MLSDGQPEPLAKRLSALLPGLAPARQAILAETLTRALALAGGAGR